MLDFLRSGTRARSGFSACVPSSLNGTVGNVPPRTSAQRKFFRGVHHVKQLLDEADAFESRDAYAFRTHVESRSTNKIKYRSIAVEREAPPDDWPLLAGDGIQNLRAALDHVVYEKSGRRSGTQFPIFTDQGEFQIRGSRMLRGVPKVMKKTIEKAQPYRNYPPNPGEAMLAQLRLLSNLDKHRALTTIASAVVREGVGVSAGVRITWEKFGTDQALGSDETPVSTFIAQSTAPLDETHIEPMFGYEVRIEGRPLSLLKGIVHDVYRVLVECETGEPLSPFAPYPL